jgi:hypothetical protein
MFAVILSEPSREFPVYLKRKVPEKSMKRLRAQLV